jgi:hypothetical protein
MRRMSFFLTQRQYRDGSKDVTRRLGHANIEAGERFLAIEKGQGLKKGERQVVLGENVCVSARAERLDAITKADCAREGFPDMTPAQFVSMFCKHMGCKPETVVTRIEFRKCEK